MEKLFRINVEPGYRYYYVIARSMDEACSKVLETISQQNTGKSLFDGDGSLRKSIDEETTIIRTVEFLTDEFIR